MEFDTPSVEKAVHQFYYDAARQAEAHHWLTLAQVSPKAWTFCWELMQLDKPAEIQFFGASCLYVKISRFWAELPTEQYAELKRKLTEYIITYANGGPRIVLTRLCVAMSCFIIRTIPDEWTTAIPDLMTTLQPSNVTHLPPDQTVGVLLELLAVLPEEFQSVTLAQSFRGLVRNHLQSSLKHVLPLVQETLSQTVSMPLRMQALRCLCNWVVFGIPLTDCSELIMSVLNCVSVAELCESAVEVLTNIVIHPDSHKYSSSLLKILEHILQLEGILARAIENKDMDTCSTMFNLFISVGESHSRILLQESLKDEQTKNNFLRLVQLVLQCSGVPGQYPVDETCSGLPFSFWYSLQDDIMSADHKNLQLYMVYFVPVYEALVDVLLHKVMYPKLEDYNTWNSDEKEQFRCYRQDVGDTLMYCYNLLREHMLQRLHTHLEVIFRRANDGEDVSQHLEACLFAFQSIAENVDLEDVHYVPKFFSLLPRLPFDNNTQVISTALDAVGAYAEWINVHPDALVHVIPLLVMGLSSPSVAPSATIALKDITRDCQLSIQPFAEQILTASQQVLSKDILKPHEQVRLMYTIGYVASVLPVATIMSFLNGLLLPYIQEMEQLSQQKEMTPSHQVQLLLRLNMLSMLFATLDTRLKDCSDDDVERRESVATLRSQPQSGPQPVLLVLQQILPVLRQVSSMWKGSLPVSEAICELMKRSVCNLLDECSPVVSDMLDLLLFLFQSHANAAALDLLKQFVVLFGNDDKQKLALRHTFLNIMNLTLELCQKGMSDNSDIVEAFFQLLSQLVKKHPSFILDNNFDLSTLFHCGVVALSVPEAPTVKAATSFLVNFIACSRDAAPMMNVVNSQGEVLLNQTLRCIGGEAPRGVMDAMADILLILNKKYFDNMCRWMNGCLNQEHFPSPRVSREQKEQFIRLVLKERTNKRKLQETVKEFTLLCRGLIGTEYAAHILPCL